MFKIQTKYFSLEENEKKNLLAIKQHVHILEMIKLKLTSPMKSMKIHVLKLLKENILKRNNFMKSPSTLDQDPKKFNSPFTTMEAIGGERK